MPNQHLLSTRRRSLVGLLLVWTSVAIGAGSAADVPAPAAPTLAAPAAADAAATDAVANSVVKIFATMRYPDTSRPWTKQAPTEVTASGVIIEGNRILTNAHVVLYATQIQIQANHAGDKIAAKVSAVAPGIDLALLTVDDNSFFESHPPLARADTLPDNRDSVLAYGYPVGGTSLSITKGIVSRIEFTAYNTSVSGLRIQIDAAINPGNSGGPAIDGEKMVGLVFSHLGGAENIGYIIPNEEIDLFLKDIAAGHDGGKPAIYDETQTLENPALRAFLKLDKSVEGVVVHKPYRTDSAYPLKEWDVITRIGDTPIDDQGMVKIGANLRVRFQYLVQQVAKNGLVPLTVVRAGKAIPIQLGVLTVKPLLIPDLNGEYPPYFIYGPLVFSKA
ncbi:MAG TPA: S1C family serine protease, partial [Steroidobacteraceae bacterium]|nr:S1C family serine protease [Steroidobacteraceae bacterium]